ncbi:28304_t:CDS:1, partial [Racocetra persica]
LMESFNKQTSNKELFATEHINNDADIETYFEESFQCNKEINDLCANIELISLKKSDSFTNFDEAKFH